jgi:hypothetical protein
MSRGRIWRNLLSKSPYEPIADHEAVTVLDEGIRTGLLEAGATPSAGQVWEAISASGDDAWNDALDRCVRDLGRMGYVICRKAES